MDLKHIFYGNLYEIRKANGSFQKKLSGFHLNEQDKYADIVEPEADIKIEGSYLIRQ